MKVTFNPHSSQEYESDYISVDLQHISIIPNSMTLSILGREGIRDHQDPDIPQEGYLVTGNGEIVGHIDYETGECILNCFISYLYDTGE